MARRDENSGWKARFFRIITSPIRLFKALCYWTGFGVIVTTLALGTWFAWIFFSLPDIQKMGFEGVKAHAKTVTLARISANKERYRWTGLREINRDLLYTVVIAEDGTFFEHDGINYDALLNSLGENIKERAFAFGGSTISQQVAKNLFLSSDKSLMRKLKEYFLTRRLERYLSKNQIVELYLNIAEFGPDLYGVGAASRYYFGVPPAKINAAEGAFLALMLPSPRRYHYSVYQNHNITPAMRRKLRRIINEMRSRDYISADQYRRYMDYDYFPAP